MIYTFDMEHGAEEMNRDISHMMHGLLHQIMYQMRLIQIDYL